MGAMPGRVALALMLAVAVPAGAATGPAAPPLFVVDGDAPRPLTLTTTMFAALPRVTVTWTAHGATSLCSGAWLIDVLAAAGLPTGDAVRGDALRTAIVATGADGYRALFTLGELDRRLGDAPVLVADACDGKPLPADDGPVRIVAARDERGARSVRQLVRLTVVRR